MTQLDFIGKEYVRMHRYSILHRVLVRGNKKSFANADDGNITVRGNKLRGKFQIVFEDKFPPICCKDQSK